jgi:hypothetical protein
MLSPTEGALGFRAHNRYREEVVRHLADMRESVLVTPPLVDLILWDKDRFSSGEISELIVHLIRRVACRSDVNPRPRLQILHFDRTDGNGTAR